ncbi:glycosyltransferase [Vibrio harveyi]|uniref:glycosyltransferase n=1 Tax=Vibrio harveyi TaxID=669 RepID=UPI003CF213CA
MKSKIAYLIPTLEVGGAEVAALNLAKNSSKFDINVYPFLGVDKKFIRSFDLEDRIKYKYTNNIFQLLYVFISILRLKPEYLVVSLWKSVPIAIACFLFTFGKIKLVTMIHSDSFFSRCDQLFLKISCFLSYLVIADSKSSADFIRKQLRTSENVKLARFLLRRIPFNPTSFSDFKWKFVFVGRVNPVKRLDLSIDAISNLRNIGIAATLDIYGTTPDNYYLKSLLKRIDDLSLKGIINFKGAVDNNLVPELLSAYDGYFCFSDKEGMAISVYEAQQAGLIILGRDIGELRYYCIDEVNSFILRDGEGIKSFLSRVVKKIDNSKGYDEFYKNYMSSLPKDKLFSERFDSLL